MSNENCAKCGEFRLHIVHTYNRDHDYHTFTPSAPADVCEHGCEDGTIYQWMGRSDGRGGIIGKVRTGKTKPCPIHGTGRKPTEGNHAE